MIPKQRQIPITYPVEPDRELLVWEKWVTIRKEETAKLSKLTSRPPVDLVMNLNENVRPDKERKVALEEAKIEKKPAIRGGPWESAPRLKQRCYCEPVYEIHRTPAEMGRPRKVAHIGVPTEIQVGEMGCAGARERIQCNLLDREYHMYRDRREKDLQENIIKIDPFRSEIRDLMIKGINPPPPPKKMPLLPEIQETLDNNPACENLSGVYALRINNTIFLKNLPKQNLTDLKRMQMESWHEECTSWSYYFNVPVNKVGTGQLYLQNLGTVTIRYCWKKLKRFIPFIAEENEYVFFFNRNEDVLAPGQEKYICFIFVSDKPSNYKEHWELSLSNISFFDTLTDKLVVNLLADSVDDYKRINAAITQVRSYIEEKSNQNIVSELIEDAISKGVSVQHEIYPYKKYFLEAEIFVMKNPECFYHQTEVMKIKELYTEMSKGKVWDLSITTWREQMLKEAYDERMKYYELLRESHSDLLKPWYEGDDLLVSKYRAMKLLLGQLADLFDSEYNRISLLYNPPIKTGQLSPVSRNAGRPSRASIAFAYSNQQQNYTIRNLFYLQMYKHVGNTIEACAGILSSIDLDRWIEFDFCRT